MAQSRDVGVTETDIAILDSFRFTRTRPLE